jgi:hypothetical protein
MPAPGQQTKTGKTVPGTVCVILCSAQLLVMVGLDVAEAATINTYTIGTETRNVDITSVSGTGPWTVQLDAQDLSNVENHRDR